MDSGGRGERRGGGGGEVGGGHEEEEGSKENIEEDSSRILDMAAKWIDREGNPRKKRIAGRKLRPYTNVLIRLVLPLELFFPRFKMD